MAFSPAAHAPQLPIDIKRQISLIAQLIIRKAIAHEPKAIPTPIFDVKILGPQLLDHFIIQQGGAGPGGGDATVFAVVLVPAGAGAGPGEGVVNLVAVADELVGGGLRGHDVLDVLGGDLAQPLDHPVGAPAHALDQRAVADRRVRPREDEVVGEVRAGERQVGFRLAFPLLRQRHAVLARHGEVRDVADVEARRADDDVEGDEFGFGLDARFGDLGDSGLVEVDVR